MEENKTYTPADYKSDQAVRWCPGCGDHAILNTLHKAMSTLGIAPHKTAVISGIGCSSRLPYYMADFRRWRRPRYRRQPLHTRSAPQHRHQHHTLQQ